MGCDSFVIPVCGSVGSGEPGAEWATMGTFCSEPMGGGEAETESLILYGGSGKAEPESLILWLIML